MKTAVLQKNPDSFPKGWRVENPDSCPQVPEYQYLHKHYSIFTYPLLIVLYNCVIEITEVLYTKEVHLDLSCRGSRANTGMAHDEKFT